MFKAARILTQVFQKVCLTREMPECGGMRRRAVRSRMNGADHKTRDALTRSPSHRAVEQTQNFEHTDITLAIESGKIHREAGSVL